MVVVPVSEGTLGVHESESQARVCVSCLHCEEPGDY